MLAIVGHDLRLASRPSGHPRDPEETRPLRVAGSSV